MKVRPPAEPAVVEQAHAPRRAPQPAQVERGRDEHVEVSREARKLSEAFGPEVPDTERIAKLREKLDDGTFKVDPDAIAEAMIREERG